MSVKMEKKCADRIKKWVVEKTAIGGNPVNMHEKASVLFDTYLLFGMVASILGVVLQMKLLAWISAYFTLMCVANYRGQEDFRQILSSFMVTLTSFLLLYNKDPAPLA